MDYIPLSVAQPQREFLQAEWGWSAVLRDAVNACFAIEQPAYRNSVPDRDRIADQEDSRQRGIIPHLGESAVGLLIARSLGRLTAFDARRPVLLHQGFHLHD